MPAAAFTLHTKEVAMTKLQQTGPAQPDHVERPEQDRHPARPKDQQRSKPKDDDDLPGAEGPLSAGANEDTYD